MAHRNFDAARRATNPDRDPVTFALGGETFTVLPDPSLGDTFDLADAPEFEPENLTGESSIAALRALKRFIRSMIHADDHVRFDRVISTLRTSEGYLLMEVAAYVAEHVTGFPTEPPDDLSLRRQTNPSGGGTSKRKPGGRSTSRARRPAARSR